MSTDINLLSHADEASIKQIKKIRVINFISILSLVIVGLISFGIFILIQNVNLKSIKEKEADVLIQLREFQDKQAKLFLLDNRIGNINKVLKTRKNISATIDSMLTKIPNQFSLSGLDVDGRSVVISGRSKSLSVMGEIIGIMTEMARKKDIIKSLTLTTLVLESNGINYYISLKSDLKYE